MSHYISVQSFSRHPADARGSAIGLRAVVLFEATKGMLVLAVGLGLLSLVHHDAQNVGEEIVRRFHLDLAHHYPRIFIDAATHIDNSRLQLLALAALFYSAVRFLEAYGLWRRRTWAEWFAIISGAAYLPIELYELISHVSSVKAVVFIVNIGIVAYLIFVLRYRADDQDEPKPA